MVMISSLLLRFSRRKLHTIVSRDTIKPSCPTPSHSKTYNLSLIDQTVTNGYVPIVAFYPCSTVNQNFHEKTIELKNSLRQTLNYYYPFAGRMKKTYPTNVDCSDDGVEFVEACNNNSLSDFLQQSDHKNLDQLFPNGLIWLNQNGPIHDQNINTTSLISPFSVQVNHFTCGGIAVATSLSHKIGDASSLLTFLKHWAAITSRSQTKIDIHPHFITNKPTTLKKLSNTSHYKPPDSVSRSFVFSNTKIKELQAKVIALTMYSKEPILNPTRVEVITWLLHKCIVAAATKTKLGNLKESGIIWAINLRNKLVERLPETTIGNIVYPVTFLVSNNNGDLMPNKLIGEYRKRKHKFQRIQNLEAVFRMFEEMISETAESIENCYVYSSICGYPMYDIDFGWGKPSKVTIGGSFKNVSILMDTPDGNGIEVQVSLDENDMNILVNDPELLAFCC
ncbi:acyltransferase-like [Rutidosis leptorrhynchoides]|uniref:acyltransferase-like n=1 Tax=Rutidosis leptorrhynchoides TaxID=125765 RepID=UPI003A9A34CB